MAKSFTISVHLWTFLPYHCSFLILFPISVQLWTTGNYHWYLKQSLLFDGPEHRIATVQWDPEHAYRLHIMCSSGQYYQYTWAWATSNSVGRTSDDQALVAVIDGGMVILSHSFSFSLSVFWGLIF